MKEVIVLIGNGPDAINITKEFLSAKFALGFISDDSENFTYFKVKIKDDDSIAVACEKAINSEQYRNQRRHGRVALFVAPFYANRRMYNYVCDHCGVIFRQVVTQGDGEYNLRGRCNNKQCIIHRPAGNSKVTH